MKSYELTYLISGQLKTEEAESLASEVTALLTKEGGLVIKAGVPKSETLGYQIKDQGAAFQVSLEFSFLPEKLKTLEEMIRKDSKILRYIIVEKKPKKREREKSPVAKPLEETDLLEKKPKKTPKKVELKEIEEKLEEILKE